MSMSNIIALLGGLGAFLFGMKYMGEGLELAAGSRMKDLLEKLTRNPVFGFLLGMLVTVVIQSSSATTVMVMGFINAGIMDLAQATGVIFGANIGTTITSVLIALDASGIAPFCIFIGAFLMMYSKKKSNVNKMLLRHCVHLIEKSLLKGQKAEKKHYNVWKNWKSQKICLQKCVCV